MWATVRDECDSLHRQTVHYVTCATIYADCASTVHAAVRDHETRALHETLAAIER